MRSEAQQSRAGRGECGFGRMVSSRVLDIDHVEARLHLSGDGGPSLPKTAVSCSDSDLDLKWDGD
jgi:hypothetical protein